MSWLGDIGRKTLCTNLSPIQCSQTQCDATTASDPAQPKALSPAPEPGFDDVQIRPDVLRLWHFAPNRSHRASHESRHSLRGSLSRSADGSRRCLPPGRRGEDHAAVACARMVSNRASSALRRGDPVEAAERPTSEAGATSRIRGGAAVPRRSRCCSSTRRNVRSSESRACRRTPEEERQPQPIERPSSAVPRRVVRGIRSRSDW